MDKFYRILYELNNRGFRNQRVLAEAAEMSLGQVNTLLRQMEEVGYLRREKRKYLLTPEGEALLEEETRKKQVEKLAMAEQTEGVHAAVILAAGGNSCFEEPVGLLQIDGTAVIEYIMQYLNQAGIERIYLVTGYKKEMFASYFKNRAVTIVENPRYKWTGTMESLAAVRELVHEDFLLVESNQIFEETAVTALLEHPAASCILLANPSGSHDEAYVELNEDGTLFRISKDIRQMNRIDGEMIGISKISYPLFVKMLEYFSRNQNPMLNYEYVIENIGRVYQIQGVMADDLAWTVIENPELYRKAEKLIYPRIQKRARLRRENNAREVFRACMDMKPQEILDCRIAGGMTNTNYRIRTVRGNFVLRIPGVCTDVMIDRKSERNNLEEASRLGLNPQTICFDEESGVKISEYIESANTLNGKTARLEENIRRTTAILRKLHASDMKMNGEFQVFREYEKYKELARGGEFYPGFQEMDEWFCRLGKRLETLGCEKKPCHNDLVAENLIEDAAGRMYLIDWEYSGYNDPIWDLASHLLECEFTPVEEELFLQYYYSREANETEQEKLLIYKICQDMLWSVWTISKEMRGEHFGSYGQDRFSRALEMRKDYEKRYGK